MAVIILDGDEELKCLLNPKDTKCNKEEPKLTSWYMAGIILTNIIMGLGLLSYPNAYKDAGGVLPAFMTQIVCLVPLISGFLVLGKAYLLHQEDTTYQAVVSRYCGRISLVICNIIVFLHNFGTCVTFLVIIADQIDEVLLFSIGGTFCDHWYMRRHLTMPALAILFILPCCFMKNLNGLSLKCISVAGVITTGYIIFLVVYKYATSSSDFVQREQRYFEWTDVIDAMPVICFSFEAHVEAIPLYSCLKKRTTLEIGKTITFGLGLAVFIYSTVGIFGYIGAGDHMASDLLLSYYPPDVPVIVGTGLMAVKAMTTYPAILFCVRIIVDDVFWSVGDRFGFSLTCIQNMHTVVIFGLSVLIAIAVPTIGHVIMLLGGSAAVLILIFPGCCMIQMQDRNGSRIHMVVGVLMVVFGTMVATTMTMKSIMKYIYSTETKELVCL